MQTEPLEFAEVRKFRFGAPVTASDGPAGKVSAMCVEPKTRQVTHVGIRTGFAFFGKQCFVPLSSVATSSKDEVVLTVSLDEMERTMTAQPNVEVLSTSTSIISSAGNQWHLTQVTINSQTRMLRHLVGRGFGGREVLIPASMITTMSKNKLAIDLGAVKPNQLVPFRPDADLGSAVYQAIYNYEPLRIDLPGIDIHAIDGTVWLKGHVSSDLNHRLVEDQLLNIEGLAQVYNELVSDSDLSSAVAHALARDPRLVNEHIGVYPRLGVVRLRGTVRSAEEKRLATQVASGIHGVASVQNELRIDPNATVVPTMASVTNEEDMVPGGR